MSSPLTSITAGRPWRRRRVADRPAGRPAATVVRRGHPVVRGQVAVVITICSPSAQTTGRARQAEPDLRALNREDADRASTSAAIWRTMRTPPNGSPGCWWLEVNRAHPFPASPSSVSRGASGSGFRVVQDDLARRFTVFLPRQSRLGFAFSRVRSGVATLGRTRAREGVGGGRGWCEALERRRR